MRMLRPYSCNLWLQHALRLALDGDNDLIDGGELEQRLRNLLPDVPHPRRTAAIGAHLLREISSCHAILNRQAAQGDAWPPVLKRGNFTSVDDLQQKVLAFIDYDNRTMAKPFK